MGNYDDAKRLPSASFSAVGDTVSGVVVEVDPTATVPRFINGKIDGVKQDDDGNPVLQVDVTLDTEAGRVVIHDGGAIHYAIGRALAEAGLEDLETQDTLTVTYSGDGKPTQKGFNPPKQYTATISR